MTVRGNVKNVGLREFLDFATCFFEKGKCKRFKFHLVQKIRPLK